MSLLLASQLAFAQLSVTVDRTEISDADILRLSIRVENATTALNPDFTALERDFEIVGVSGPNQSSRVSIVNGRQTSEVYVSWDIRLMARRQGTLMIPSFQIGQDKSKPIPIKVAQQSASMKQKMAQLVFFDTSVDKETAYVQGEIIYTIKLYYVENISGDFPAPPAIKDAVVETVENERRYDAIIDGRRYYVLEKRYAIYPQRSGALSVPTQTFSGFRVGPGFFSTREPVLARSTGHEILVKPKPDSYPGENWLPAKSVLLAESWSANPPKFKVGEPINRILMITAEGLSGSMLPRFSLNLDAAKTYQDPPVEDQQFTAEGLRSSQKTTIGIVPTRPGKLVIPAINIPWWNTETNQLAYARLPEQVFDVAPGLPTTTTPITPITIEESPAADQLTETASDEGFWKLLAIAMAVLWLQTLVWLIWRAKRKGKASQTETTQPTLLGFPAEASLHRDLLDACHRNNAGKAHGLLLGWGRARHPGLGSIFELGQILDDEALGKAIALLDQSLYSASPDSNWQGGELASRLKLYAPGKRNQQKSRADSLPETMNPAA